MTDRREVLVRAAIAVLAAGGGRALTHRAVDTAAGLPAGATSNCFRTRSDLLAGVLDRILTAETEHYGRLPGRGGPDGPDGPDELADDVAAMVDHLTGAAREMTVARLALALEAGSDPEIAPMLDRGRGVWRDRTVARLRDLGATDPPAGADGLLALVDGFVVDRVRGRGDPASDPRTIARALIRGLGVADPQRSPGSPAG